METEKRKLHRKTFYRQNRKRLLATQKEYGRKHSKEIRQYQREYYRYRSYGITKEEFDKILQSQNNKCSICESAFDLTIKKLSPHVDHNHNTGKIRSLLCMNCNCGIGHFGDNPEFLIKAGEYLKYHH